MPRPNAGVCAPSCAPGGTIGASRAVSTSGSDATLDEDRSRVRTPNAAHALGLFRRLVVSVAHGWIERAQKKNSRASLRTFVTALRAHGARRAFDLVTATAPQAWNRT